MTIRNLNQQKTISSPNYTEILNYVVSAQKFSLQQKQYGSAEKNVMILFCLYFRDSNTFWHFNRGHVLTPLHKISRYKFILPFILVMFPQCCYFVCLFCFQVVVPFYTSYYCILRLNIYIRSCRNMYVNIESFPTTRFIHLYFRIQFFFCFCNKLLQQGWKQEAN